MKSFFNFHENWNRSRNKIQRKTIALKEVTKIKKALSRTSWNRIKLYQKPKRKKEDKPLKRFDWNRSEKLKNELLKHALEIASKTLTASSFRARRKTIKENKATTSIRRTTTRSKTRFERKKMIPRSFESLRSSSRSSNEMKKWLAFWRFWRFCLHFSRVEWDVTHAYL